MNFSDRLKGMLEQGWETSKELAAKAGAKAQDLGEKGVLKLDVMQLENQAKKWVERLGTEVYRLFVEKGCDTVNAADPVIKGLLDEISSIRGSIESKEAQLASRYDRST